MVPTGCIYGIIRFSVKFDSSDSANGADSVVGLRRVCAALWILSRFGTRDEMMRHRLRLFTGEEETTQAVAENVTVRLSDISRALLDAARWNRTWLADFADDEIQVSSDLYEIISAYMRLRPGA